MGMQYPPNWGVGSPYDPRYQQQQQSPYGQQGYDPYQQAQLQSPMMGQLGGQGGIPQQGMGSPFQQSSLGSIGAQFQPQGGSANAGGSWGGTGGGTSPSKDPLRVDTFGNPLDPEKSVRNALRKKGVWPNSAHPRVKSMIKHAEGLMMPILDKIASGGTATLDDLEGAVDAQVNAALGGQGSLYSPSQGMAAVKNLMSAAERGQSVAGGEGALDPALQFIAGLMSNDDLATYVLTSSVLGGLPDSLSSIIGRSYKQLPEQAQYMATLPENKDQNMNIPSYLSFFLGNQKRTPGGY